MMTIRRALGGIPEENGPWSWAFLDQDDLDETDHPEEPPLGLHETVSASGMKMLLKMGMCHLANVSVCCGCCNKVLHTGWLKQQKCTLPQSWRPDV